MQFVQILKIAMLIFQSDLDFYPGETLVIAGLNTRASRPGRILANFEEFSKLSTAAGVGN